MKTVLCALVLAACGSSTAGMAGPSMNGHMGDPAEEGTSAIQSNDILGRELVTTHAVVKHVLIGWKDLGVAYGGTLDPRAAGRTQKEADELAQKTLVRVRGGEDIDKVMKEVSEDKGSSQFGKPYDVTVDAKLVFEFKRLSLRLNVGEAGLVRTQYGWHIIKRIE